MADEEFTIDHKMIMHWVSQASNPLVNDLTQFAPTCKPGERVTSVYPTGSVTLAQWNEPYGRGHRDHVVAVRWSDVPDLIEYLAAALGRRERARLAAMIEAREGGAA